ncbi:gluconate kinase [Caulobacter vibrioides]|uniref:Gluconate kinase n=1 Tax=Caulobacter vibrioides (strain NA1000 / CB15N) TaxID=565050 RepID=A0A0H3C892_CAUVN|nr:gluconate kinase [Caulobacter vibrioides]YP_002516337.1 gluconate kinase [Caulobacter vibrioides NA1000]ACL94429.1 gluconate kinase [Caulobacter vibrioides NA1000]AVH77068.1 hypothetical protein CA607_20320 [Caulobacter vibrioides]QXZ52994.1 hypothetical protein KZH45_04785 [Caulobacter vibrioides]
MWGAATDTGPLAAEALRRRLGGLGPKRPLP